MTIPSTWADIILDSPSPTDAWSGVFGAIRGDRRILQLSSRSP